jgi:hypothetical protein
VDFLKELARHDPAYVADVASPYFVGVACEETIPRYHDTVTKLDGGPAPVEAVARLLKKAVPQRCRTRMFEQISQRIIKESGDAANVVTQWAKCSLAAGYRHSSTGSRTSTHRARMVRFVHSPEFQGLFLGVMLREAPNLLLLVLRDYIAFELSSNMPLGEVMGWGIDVPMFMEINNDAMNRVRALKLWRCGADPRVLEELKAITDESRNEMRVVGTRSSRDSFMNTVFTYKVVRESLAKFENSTPCVLVDHYIRFLDPLSEDPMADFEPLARAAGVSGACLRDLNSMRVTYDSGKLGRKATREGIRRIATAHPVSLAAFVHFCRAWTAHSAIQSYPIPRDIAIHQAKALCKRFGCADSTHVPYEACTISFCDTCGASRVVRESAAKNRNAQLSDNISPWGVKQRAYDIVGGEIFCAKRKCGSRMKTLLLLGHVVIMNHKMITLCCEPGCGAQMVVQSTPECLTELGFCCVACAVRKRQRAAGRPAFDDADAGDDNTVDCVVCGAVCSNPQRVHVLEFGLYLCKRHFHRNIVGVLDRARPRTKAEAVTVIVEFHRLRQAQYVERNRKKWQRLTSSFRRQNRSGHRDHGHA